MSNNKSTDSAGRKQPSKYLRKKRAANGAKHRWKHKWQLVPGFPPSWSERSFANKQRHLAAAKKGGEVTGHQIREQQRLFWRWYHGDCKAQLRGPFKAVVETFERIEAAYVQRYGYKGPKWIAWEGFFAHVFQSYVLVAIGRTRPEDVERDMWALYQQFMDADDAELYGDGRRPGLLKALHDFDDALEAKRVRLGLWRSKNSDPMTSKSDKNTRII
jgi:hypothetical protein